MGGGPSKTTTVQQANLPPGAQQLVDIGAQQTQQGLDRAPITDFQNPNIENIAGIDPATLDALAYYRSLAGGAATPGILNAFNQLQLPLIQQQVGLAGLAHSDALGKAVAQGQATALMPALQLQKSGADAEAQLGDYLRQAHQQELSAPYQDFLRRQGISESLLSGATGLIPSSIGQSGSSTVNNGGFLGYLLGYRK
jgi:hypothetical protein